MGQLRATFDLMARYEREQARHREDKAEENALPFLRWLKKEIGADGTMDVQFKMGSAHAINYNGDPQLYRMRDIDATLRDRATGKKLGVASFSLDRTFTDIAVIGRNNTLYRFGGEDDKKVKLQFVHSLLWEAARHAPKAKRKLGVPAAGGTIE